VCEKNTGEFDSKKTSSTRERESYSIPETWKIERAKHQKRDIR
jgi:hypothetical protein